MLLDKLPATLELVTQLRQARHVERELLILHVQELILEDGGLSRAALRVSSHWRGFSSERERTHKGQHLPNRFPIGRHGQEQRQGFDDLLDRRDELVRNLRDGYSLFLRDLEDF